MQPNSRVVPLTALIRSCLVICTVCLFLFFKTLFRSGTLITDSPCCSTAKIQPELSLFLSQSNLKIIRKDLKGLRDYKNSKKQQNMTKTQQTLWLAGFTGVSTACIFSFMISGIHSIERPSTSQPDALLAANSDKNQLVTLREVRQMLNGNFAKLDIDKDGMINPDEYAGRHISLFLAIDSDSESKTIPQQKSASTI